MLIPRFSLRILLLIITFSSVFFFVMMLATRGHVWAWGVTIAISSVFAVTLVHATLFLLAWSLTQVGMSWKQPTVESPFASAKPPPQQIIPPEDPE
jgi:hypothetical protein